MVVLYICGHQVFQQDLVVFCFRLTRGSVVGLLGGQHMEQRVKRDCVDGGFLVGGRIHGCLCGAILECLYEE